MLDIVCFAANPGFPLTLGTHRFSAASDHQLEHWIDGDLRAVVPPEGMADYAKSWPQCADLVAQLTRAPAAAPKSAAQGMVDKIVAALSSREGG